MKNKFLIIFTFLVWVGACKNPHHDEVAHHEEISKFMDSFHLAAARADFQNYFDMMSDDAVFLGTDATEYWKKDSFMNWARPFFDRRKAWNLIPMNRHIYAEKNVAWFDELLQTSMKICRGSGVLVKEGGHWKIKQYVLSMTIPNDQVKPVIALKTKQEDSIIHALIK